VGVWILFVTRLHLLNPTFTLHLNTHWRWHTSVHDTSVILCDVMWKILPPCEVIITWNCYVRYEKVLNISHIALFTALSGATWIMYSHLHIWVATKGPKDFFFYILVVPPGAKGAVCGLRSTYSAGECVLLKPEECHLSMPSPMHACPRHGPRASS
jgi:hypothetical protein